MSEDIHPHITRLPVEVIEQFAYFFDSPDLLHLRATCRGLRSHTEQEVGRRYFSDRVFTIGHESSLQVLSAISQHSVFAKSMRKIGFSVAVFLTPTTPPRPPDEDPWANMSGRQRRRQRRKQLLKGQTPLVIAQVRFQDSHLDVELLRSILVNFKRVGNIPDIVAGGEDFFGEAFQERAREYQRLGPRLASLPAVGPDPGRRDDSFFSGLNRAIREAEYPVQSLLLGCLGFEIRPSELRCEPASHSYASLKDLRLDLTDDRSLHPPICTIRWGWASLITGWCTDLDDHKLEQEKAFGGEVRRHLLPFLREAQNLESLSIQANHRAQSIIGGEKSYLDADVFATMLTAATVPGPDGACAFRHLRRLETNMLGMSFEDMVAFVAATRHSLTAWTIRAPVPPPFPTGAARLLQAAYGGEWDLQGLVTSCIPYQDFFDENTARFLARTKFQEFDLPLIHSGGIFSYTAPPEE